MTPADFIRKWQSATLKERSAAQEHFIDLCRLLEEPTPAEADPDGTWYSFEKGAKKTGGGEGWADVWKRGCFAWEYKGKGKDLNAALKQLQLYALALESPPLLIVSDIETIVIHTAFTNAVQETHVIPLADLAQPDARQRLKWAFTDPERLRPGQTREELTEAAAGRFAALAQRLRERGFEGQAVAHFLNRLLFCLFAEDGGLLPDRIFTRLLDSAARTPKHSERLLQTLFAAMAEGGPFGPDLIDWFNGGLFDDSHTLPLEVADLRELRRLAELDWSSIEPAIFGTLFERGLDPDKRSQLGAHYTDRGAILRLIEPVIKQPLLAEWNRLKAEIEQLHAKIEAAEAQHQAALAHAKAKADKTAAGKAGEAARRAINGARGQAATRYQEFLTRLRAFRVLDPACGSGNFLYLALQTLKDLEHQVMLDAEAFGLERQFPAVGPEAVHGIEVNPYAAELARVTVWIGEIQWMLSHGYSLNRNPVLRPLDTIEQRDAVLNPDGSEAAWPPADVIIGNPPFLGGSKLLGVLGENYTRALRQTYQGRVPGGADLVCYWFEKARAQIEAGQAQRAGLVATNSIRGGVNRRVLERIRETGALFNAWSDEPWINEGAAVRVSLICLERQSKVFQPCLDGRPVAEIYADLTASNDHERLDLTQAHKLIENKNICFEGIKKYGAFDIDGDLARLWLQMPNPHGRPNAGVIRPWINAADMVRRSSDTWIIDFTGLSEEEAALYEPPFSHIKQFVQPERIKDHDKRIRKQWWLFQRSRLQMRHAIAGLSRFMVTPVIAKHRLFMWCAVPILPMNLLDIIARADDTTFGVLHSRFHEWWSLRMGTSLEDRPRYTPTTCFETFPFPEGVLSDPDPDACFPAVAAAARRLNELRERWLNPPEWIQRVSEVVPGYPDRLLPVDEKAAQELKKRTLTHLYNQRPAWLVNAHRALDEAVAAAYGWPVDLSDGEILRRLLTLNRERAAAERGG